MQTHREGDDERANEGGQVDEGCDDALEGEHVLQLAQRAEEEGRAAGRVRESGVHRVGGMGSRGAERQYILLEKEE